MLEEHQEKLLIGLRNSDTLIIVEGKKDRKALERAGLDNIIEISGKSPEKVVDIVNDKQLQVAILTDYDREGIKQYKRLKALFQGNGIKTDDNLRKNFKRVFHINTIEEFVSYLK